MPDTCTYVNITERHESKGKPLTEGHSAEAQLMQRLKLSDLLRILMWKVTYNCFNHEHGQNNLLFWLGSKNRRIRGSDQYHRMANGINGI